MITVKNLRKEFTLQKKKITVLSDLSFSIAKGETLGLVGESGCGKSTTGRCLLRLEEPTAGEICYNGKDVVSMNKEELFEFRRRAQIIFQDPYSSLNPRMTTADIIAEPLRVHRIMPDKEIPAYLKQLLDLTGLSQSALGRFPHEFSGGQRQRIGIARALALKPDFIVCDEPISALDVSVQAQIINLLKSLQKELGLTYLFIAHDLSIVKYISDRVAVMYMGQIVETAPAEELYKNPKHPYTQALLASIPVPDPEIERKRERYILQGEIPSLLAPPKGCPFASRCPKAQEICRHTPPAFAEQNPGHFAACHFLTN